MRIKRILPRNNLIIDQLEVGDVFDYLDSLYMKVKINNSDVNAIKLYEGTPHSFTFHYNNLKYIKGQFVEEE